MCKFIKDDGDECGRDAEPFCHQHAETVQAAQYEIQQLRDDLGEALLAATDEVSPSEWTPTTCSSCGTAVRVVCACIDQVAFNPDAVVETLALTCGCGHSMRYDPTWDNLPKSEIPDEWLFEEDR